MTILVIVCIVLGTFFFITATIGLLRFPDFYCRMHATAKGDTLGALLILTGLALYSLHNDLSLSAILVGIKIMFICVFIFISNPTAIHAITKAGLEAGVKPLTKEDSQ